MKVLQRDILHGFYDRKKERLFIFEYFERFKIQVRIGILISILIYMVFYFIDINVFPELEPQLLVNRLVVSSVFALIFGLSFTRFFARYMQCFLLFFGIVAALGILWKLWFLNLNGYDFSFFYPGLILTSAIVTFYLRVRFVHAVLLNLFVTGAYILLFVFFIHPVPGNSPINLNQTFASSLFFITCSSFLSLYGAYYLEIITRNEYFSQMHFKQLNSNLEDIVEQRTAELEDEKRKNISRLLEGQEKERERISKELHDNVNNQISLLRLSLENQILETGFSGMQNSIDTLLKINEDVRQIAHCHSAYTLRECGLENAIRSLIDKVPDNSKIQFDFHFIGIEEKLPEDLSLSVYRIFQEALSNIVKHASATKVELQIIKIDDELNLSITDNGRGFDVLSYHNGGIGLYNMRLRIEQQFKGEFNIDSKAGFGTTIIANVKIGQP